MNKTEIEFNGSKWAGQDPDTLETLLSVMDTYTIDPTFEHYGNFICAGKDYLTIHFHGNFFDISHVFSIVTSDSLVIEKLVNAIRKNKNSDRYLKARLKCIEWDKRQATIYRPAKKWD